MLVLLFCTARMEDPYAYASTCIHQHALRLPVLLANSCTCRAPRAPSPHQVRAATHRGSGSSVAVKSIRKSLLAASDVAGLRREVEILHHLAGHPHISQLLGVFEDSSSLHLVLELYQVRVGVRALCGGGG